MNCKILEKKFVAHESPPKNHYLSLLDMDIVLHWHLHKQCISSRPTWISWLIHQLLTLHSTTKSTPSLPPAFVVGLLVLPREKYPCHKMQLQRCTPTNAQVCNDCTYRQNSVFDVLSEDFKLSISFCLKVLNTL